MLTREEAIAVLASAEWAAKNARRGELIQKKIRLGLDAAEGEEFERLQFESSVLVRTAHPRPPLPALPPMGGA